MAEHSKNMTANMENKMNQYITAGNIIGMVVHSFLVVLREGVETVFSLQRLQEETSGKR